MNRRSFLSFLSVAPVAVPMAAQALASNYREWSTSFGWVEGAAGEFIGVDGASAGETITFTRPPYPCSYYYGDAIEEADRLLALLRNSSSVEAQMRADDLFDFEPHLRNTAEPQAPVSPDNQNEIPTAQADDLCHFGQDTETLSPTVSRRLLRAWGVNEARVGA